MMKKIAFLTTLLFCICSLSFSQETEKQLYYFQQYENTESALKKYLSDILSVNSINQDSLDIVYLNIIPPMGCPRCEGIVVEYNRLLQKQSAGKDFIINVAVYSKPNALDGYLEHQHFSGNVLFRDSTQTLTGIFHTLNNSFAVPYITKISLKSGRLISEYSALGINMSSELVQEIRAKQDYLPLMEQIDQQQNEESPVSVAVHAKAWEDLSKSRFFNMPVDSFVVKDADKIPYVYDFSLDKNAHFLILRNYLTNSFSLYSLNDKRIFVKKTDFEPTAAENKMFISQKISPKIYDYMMGMNLLVSMYLNASFAGDNVYIMASLPNVFIEKSDSTESIGYANQPVCLLKNHEGGLVRMILLDSIQKPEQYALSHSVGILFEDSTMAFQLQKGWPVFGIASAPEDNENNPFKNSFYMDANSVLFYNSTNRNVHITSPLDSLYAKYKLGYFFSSPMEKNIHGVYYWTDTHIGKVYKLTQDFDKQTHIGDLFDIEKVLKQMPFTENLAYLESYSKYFSRQIVDFNISPKGLLTALVSDNKHFYYYEADKNGKINISAFLDSMGTKKITNLQFSENIDSKQTVYALYQDNQQIVIYIFKF